DEEHGAGAGQVARSLRVAQIGARARLRLAALVARQEDGELRALAGLAFDEDEAARLLDDAVDGGETKPGAGAHLLRREERLEDARQILAWNADAGVGHLDLHVFAGRHYLVGAPHRIFARHVGGADGERAARRHGVPRIDGEIDDDLLELALVDLDEA